MFQRLIFASCVLSALSVFGQTRAQTHKTESFDREKGSNEKKGQVAKAPSATSSHTKSKRKVLAVRPRTSKMQPVDDEDYSLYEANNSDDVMISNSYAQDNTPKSEMAKNTLPPSTRFTLDHGMYLSGSVLYWKNMQSNLGYAVAQHTPTNAQTDPSTELVTLIGDYKALDFNWDYGYRGCVGWRFGANSWDLSAEYTYFSQTTNDAVSRSPTGPVYPYRYLKGLGSDFFESYISDISSSIHFHYHVIDLVLQRPIFQTRSCLVRFLVGGRGAYINQGWSTIYSQIGSDTSYASPYETVKNDWRYKAGGIKAGLNMQWYWGWGFSVRALAAGASTIGYYESRSSNIKVDYSLPSSNNQYVYGDISPKMHRMIPSYQLSVGMQWRGGNRHGGLFVYADWEMNSWRDLHQQYNYTPKHYSEPVSGSVSKDSVDIQGLTGGVGIEF